MIRQWQQYLIRAYKLFRLLPKFGGPATAGLQRRHRAPGPSNLPRTDRTDAHWEGHHRLRHHHNTAGCSRCGRISKARRQGRLQQWRRPCQALAVHQRRLNRGHRPQWQGHWRCTQCPLRGPNLAKRPCLRMHPTGGRRATFKRPPWTMFPRRRPARDSASSELSAPPTSKRPRMQDSDLPPPRGEIDHNIIITATFEWCTRCGRTTAAAMAGRRQQWRRQCVVLPSFQRKIGKGHSLTFDGQWRCTACPCPSHRLTIKKCRGPSSSARPLGPAPQALPAPGGNVSVPKGPAVPAPKRVLTLRDFFSSAPPAHRARLGSPSRQGVG